MIQGEIVQYQSEALAHTAMMQAEIAAQFETSVVAIRQSEASMMARARHWQSEMEASLGETKSELVVEARRDEIKGIHKCKVWDKVPISECYANTGGAPVGTRWVDTNKGDENNPNYRSRIVGREFNNKKRDDLFAATPPLEACCASC